MGHRTTHQELYHHTDRYGWDHDSDSKPEDWRIDTVGEAVKLFNAITREGLIKEIPTLETASKIKIDLHEYVDDGDWLVKDVFASREM
jgi:hypothetical protein